MTSWNPLMGFLPLQHMKPKGISKGRSSQNLPRTPAGFGYPLGVPHSSRRQVLFHTLGAHGVCLTELFSWLKAADLSSRITSLQLISWFSINSQRRKPNIRHLALRFWSLSQAVPGWKLLSSGRARCSHRIIASRDYLWTMRPASRPFLFCSYRYPGRKTMTKNLP